MNSNGFAQIIFVFPDGGSVQTVNAIILGSF